MMERVRKRVTYGLYHANDPRLSSVTSYPRLAWLALISPFDAMSA